MKLHTRLIGIVLAIAVIILLFFPCVVNAAEEGESLVVTIKTSIAFWYYVLRSVSIAVMLIILIFVGIKMAISTIASDKALYKQMLLDWVVGIILVFSIHYVMLLVITLNETLVHMFSNVQVGMVQDAMSKEFDLNKYSNTAGGRVELSLYEAVKTRAYDAKLINGTTGMIMYMVLVWYAIKFSFIYFKRYLTIVILTLIAPAVSVAYAVNKVMTGKSKIYGTWFTEYFMTVMIQAVHALIYTVFVSTMIIISLDSIPGAIIAFMLLNFMSKAEQLFRRIFKFSDSAMASNAMETGASEMVTAFKGVAGIMVGSQAAKMAMKYQKGAMKLAGKPIGWATSMAFGGAMAGIAGMQISRGRSIDEYDEENTDGSYKRKSDEEVFEGRIRKYIKDEEGLRRLEELRNKKKRTDEEEDEYNELLKEEKGMLNSKKKLDKEIAEMARDNISTKDVFKAKMKNLFDTRNYVEKRDGKLKRKRRKTRKVPGRIFKREPKTNEEGAGATFLQNLALENLFGLTFKDKQLLKEDLMLIKNMTVGFAGCMAGLPIMIDNPKVGLPILATGLYNSGKLFGKKIPNTVYKPERKRTFTWAGYGNKVDAIKTIEQQAREETEAIRNNQVVENVKQNHGALYSLLKGGKAVVNIASLGMFGNYNKLLSNNMHDMDRLHVKQINKAIKRMEKQKATTVEKEIFKAVNEAMDNVEANNEERQEEVEQKEYEQLGFEEKLEEGTVVEVEDGKYVEFTNVQVDCDEEEITLEEADEQIKEQYKSNYMTNEEEEAQEQDGILEEWISEQKEIKKTYEQPSEANEDNRRRNSEETITINEVQVTKIKTDAPTKAIDDAIIKVAMRKGQTDIAGLDLNRGDINKEVVNELTGILERRGLKDVNEDIEKFIPNLKDTLLNRKAVLDKGKESANTQELAQKSFVEVMKEEKITNPKDFTPEALMEVMKKTNEKRNEVINKGRTKGTSETEEDLKKKKIEIEGEPEEKIPSSIVKMVQAIHSTMASTSPEENKKPKVNTEEVVREMKQTQKTKINNEAYLILEDAQRDYAKNINPKPERNETEDNGIVIKNKQQEDLQKTFKELLKNRKEAAKLAKATLGKPGKRTERLKEMEIAPLPMADEEKQKRKEMEKEIKEIPNTDDVIKMISERRNRV